MQKFKLTVLLSCAFLGFLIIGSNKKIVAQDLEKDLLEIVNLIDNSPNIMITQEINYYENYDNKNPKETSLLKLKKQDNQFYTSAFGIESIIKDGLSIQLDHNTQTIIIDQNIDNELIVDLSIDIDRIKESASNIKYKEQGSYAYYTCYYNSGEQTKSEIWYKKANHELTKLVFYLRIDNQPNIGKAKSDNGPRLEILFKELKFNCEFENSTFSFDQFITNSEDGIEPQKKYIDYKLINNIRY